MAHLRGYLWRSSQDCYTLAHLLVHLRLQGGSRFRVVANASNLEAKMHDDPNRIL